MTGLSGIELARQLQEAARPTDVPPTPSFEPWLVRVRTIRAAAMSLTMFLTAVFSYLMGYSWVDATLRGFVMSTMAFFISWAASLWICSELYAGEVKAARTAWADREKRRQEQIRELYRQRIDLLHGVGTIDDEMLDNLVEFQPPPGADEPAPDVAAFEAARRAA